MLCCALAGALLPAGCCWLQLRMDNRNNEVTTTIRLRMEIPPNVSEKRSIVLTLAQRSCFCKGTQVTGDYRGNLRFTETGFSIRKLPTPMAWRSVRERSTTCRPDSRRPRSSASCPSQPCLLSTSSRLSKLPWPKPGRHGDGWRRHHSA